VRTLEAANWDFAAAPEAFTQEAGADVFAKELAIIFDGSTLTRIGRLVLAGVGPLFNLMGPIHPQAIFRTTSGQLIDSLNEQVGSRGVRDFPEYERFGVPQRVDFFGHTLFYQLRDLVFWSVLHGSGVSPSTLEHVARNFSAGMVVQNALYAPNIPARSLEHPVSMLATDLSVSFPTRVIEWMDRPLYGGLLTETIHVEYLLTLTPTDVSHPYLPLVDEGQVEYAGRRYYMRRFAGISPKAGLRGPGISPERETPYGSASGWISERDLASSR